MIGLKIHGRSITKKLNGIPNLLPNYMKEHISKGGFIGLDYMLYRHVKEIMSNYTTYFLCSEDSIGKEHKKVYHILKKL